MITRINFAGFYVILTEQRNSERITNVGFSQHIKKLIKQKKAYPTDHEHEYYDGMHVVSRKVCIDSMSVQDLHDLIDDSCITYECETMGSLTLEYGWLNAKAFRYYDYYSNQETQAYISILWEDSGFNGLDKNHSVFRRSAKFIYDNEEAIFDMINEDKWDELEEYCDNLEFTYDTAQLEIQFQ